MLKLKMLFFTSLFVLCGAGCSSETDKLIIEQQKKIDDLTKKIEAVQQTNNLSTSSLVTTSSTTSIKEASTSTTSYPKKLPAKLAELKDAPAKKLVVKGTTPISYESFVPYIVQIICSESSGSGTIISPNTILTNYHVIEGESECLVGFTTNASQAPSQWVTGIIKAVDKSLDRAIVSVKSELANKTIKKCNSSDTKIADELVAIGYPGAGGSTITLTNGNISGFIKHYIKTSAKINPGNSGGAAIHKSGCYLGIPSAVNASGFDALGLIIDERIGGVINDNDSGISSVDSSYQEQVQTKKNEQVIEQRKIDEIKSKYSLFLQSHSSIYTQFLQEIQTYSDLIKGSETKSFQNKAMSDSVANLALLRDQVSNLEAFDPFTEISQFKEKYIAAIQNLVNAERARQSYNDSFSTPNFDYYTSSNYYDDSTAYYRNSLDYAIEAEKIFKTISSKYGTAFGS